MRPLKMASGPGERARSRPKRLESPSSLTGEEIVADVVADHPELRLLLLSYGVCSCCCGDTTLKVSAQVRGIPLETILDDIRRELVKAG